MTQTIAMCQWINEIHYDNTSTDINECIEIAGPAGTDMSCYSIVLYNGNTGSSYDTDALSGLIPDEGCGFGAISICYSSNGIQNGAPDGIVLYNTCTASVVQFLSYEGSFTATNGVANGMSSTNIGVAESSSTPVGSSMQLIGIGSNYGAFTWESVGNTASMGVLNTGQTISPCGSNTITTVAVSTPPFTVDCTAPSTDAGSVTFTSTGTYNAGNEYTVQLSDASGSFSSPINIGLLISTANSGLINFTIPSAISTGTGYLIRIISSDPFTIGSSSSSFSITQNTPCLPTLPNNGLIINEWSNGPSGNQEYYEFVVAGECGTLIDIQGYILDDNNATFTNPADYDATASGIAPGHFRFTYDPQWASIPVGSLIVVYNAQEPNSSLPADDPNDSNNDSLYVVPHTSSLFERCTSYPASSSPDSVYAPCTYSVAPLGGWNPLSLRNGGDAIQVRNPDGSYYHGVSYGGSEMTGGPDNLKLFTGSGVGTCGWFTDGDFFDISNWSYGAVAVNQTPGLPNNAANLTWLLSMRDITGISCPFVVLPVELSSFEGKKIDDVNVLYWETLSENNSDYFKVERSANGIEWTEVGKVAAAGSSESTKYYSIVDDRMNPVINYYRLHQFDMNGESVLYKNYVAIDNTIETKLHLVKIINVLGQEIDESTPGVQIHIFDNGTNRKYFMP